MNERYIRYCIVHNVTTACSGLQQQRHHDGCGLVIMQLGKLHGPQLHHMAVVVVAQPIGCSLQLEGHEARALHIYKSPCTVCLGRSHVRL